MKGSNMDFNVQGHFADSMQYCPNSVLELEQYFTEPSDCILLYFRINTFKFFLQTWLAMPGC